MTRNGGRSIPSEAAPTLRTLSPLVRTVISATTYTVSAQDAGRTLDFDSSSPVTVTFNSLSMLPGQRLAIRQLGTGLVSLTSSDDLIRVPPGRSATTTGQYSAIEVQALERIPGFGQPLVLSGNLAGGIGALRGVWDSGTTYATDDLVIGSNNALYASLAGSNLNHNPTTDAGVHWTATPGTGSTSYRGAWSSSTTYAAGDLVTGSDDVLYVSLAGSNLNHNPTTDAGVHWSVAPNVPYKGVWSSSTTYASGDLVTGSDESIYVSLAGSNLNHDPTTDGGVHWSLPPATNSAPLIELVNVGGNSGSAVTVPDVRIATMHTYTLNAATVTFTMPTAAAGKSLAMKLTQDGSGTRVPVFTGVRWPGGTMPAASTAASAIDIYAFACFDGTHWEGVQPAKGLA